MISFFRTLNLLLVSELEFNSVDRVLVLQSVLSNHDLRGVNLVLDLLTTNFTAVNEIIGSTPTIIKDVASRITTEDLLDKFKVFVEANVVYFSDSLKATVTEAMADAEYNLRWLRDVTPQFDSYFSTPTEAPDDDGGVARIMLNSSAAMFTCLVVLLNY